MEKSLITRNIHYSYDNEYTFKYPDIDCGKGQHLLISGLSGCGKTTLLHLIAGLIKPSRGSIQVNNTDITTLDNKKLDRFRGRKIGIVFQHFCFIKSLTAEENLILCTSLNHLPVDRRYLESLFNDLNITHCMTRKTYNMSQGELQRLSIARAVINKPALILADEPTSSLDDKNCEEALKLLQLQADRLQASLVVVTHDNRVKPEFPNAINITL